TSGSSARRNACGAAKLMMLGPGFTWELRWAQAMAIVLVPAIACQRDAPAAPPATRAGHYAAPGGTSGGSGSATRPWDLPTALAGGAGLLHPGDTVWLRGGSYRGTFTSALTGTPAAPIVVRAYPGERAVLDG